MSATTAMFTLAGIWIGIGLLLALIMARHGHDPFAWWLLGTSSAGVAASFAVGATASRPAGHRTGRASPSGRTGARSSVS